MRERQSWPVTIMWALTVALACLLPADAYSAPVWVLDGGDLEAQAKEAKAKADAEKAAHIENLKAQLCAIDKNQCDDELLVNILVGMSTSVSAEASGVQPGALLSLQVPLSHSSKGPILDANLGLNAAAAQTIDLAKVETYKSVELGLGVYQPLFPSKLRFGLYGQVGVASRLRGATEPAQKSPLWGSLGLGIREKTNKHYLTIGLGGDQRISPDVAQFALTVRGKASIKDLVVKGSTAALLVDIIRGLDVSTYGQGHPGRDGGTSSYRVNLLAGW